MSLATSRFLRGVMKNYKEPSAPEPAIFQRCVVVDYDSFTSYKFHEIDWNECAFLQTPILWGAPPW